MAYSRRTFLKVGTTASISTALILQTASAATFLGAGREAQGDPEPTFAVPQESQLDALNSLSIDTFSALKNTTFRLYSGAVKTVEVELIEVKALKDRPKLDAFSLIFKGPADLSLAQNTYRVKHKYLKSFKLLIVPVKQDGSGVYYEAIFNRLRF